MEMDGISGAQRAAMDARARQAMKREGHTIPSVACALEVSEKTVRRWLDPRSPSTPNVRQVVRICNLLDMNPTYWLYGIGIPRLSKLRQVVGMSEAFVQMQEAIEAARDAAERLERYTRDHPE